MKSKMNMSHFCCFILLAFLSRAELLVHDVRILEIRGATLVLDVGENIQLTKDDEVILLSPKAKPLARGKMEMLYPKKSRWLLGETFAFQDQMKLHAVFKSTAMRGSAVSDVKERLHFGPSQNRASYEEASDSERYTESILLKSPQPSILHKKAEFDLIQERHQLPKPGAAPWLRSTSMALQKKVNGDEFDYLQNRVDAVRRLESAPQTSIREEREGELWSQGISDKDMRAHFALQERDKEKERRELSRQEVFSFDLFIFMTSSITPHTSSVDQNPKTLGRFWWGGAEWHLGQYLPIDTWRFWTLTTAIQIGEDNLDVGPMNLTFQETSLGISLNYYLWGSPFIVKAWQWSLGAGLYLGHATASGLGATSDYQYSVTTAPQLHCTWKYRFYSHPDDWGETKGGLSIQFGLKSEFKKYLLKSTNTNSVNDQIGLIDNQVYGGLGVYF